MYIILQNNKKKIRNVSKFHQIFCLFSGYLSWLAYFVIELSCICLKSTSINHLHLKHFLIEALKNDYKSFYLIYMYLNVYKLYTYFIHASLKLVFVDALSRKSIKLVVYLQFKTLK